MNVNHTLGLQSCGDIRNVTIDATRGRALNEDLIIAELPGFNDAHGSDTQKMAKIAKWLEKT